MSVTYGLTATTWILLTKYIHIQQ